MKALIIGGTGLVGPNVIQEITAGFADAQISTITRSGKSLFAEHSFKADRNDCEQFTNILAQTKPDVLIDMIPFTAEDATTTANIVKKMVPTLPVIALSSIDIYAAYAKLHSTEDIDYQHCPITETMTLRQKLSVEGTKYDKLNVERIYCETLQNVTILRLPATYGWPDTSRITPYLDPMLAGEKSITITKTMADWKFSRCLNKNAAYAIFKTIAANQHGQHIYNTAEETTYSELEWCQKIARHCGWNGKIIIAAGTADPIDFKQDFHVSSQKIRTELGYTDKYDPNEGLADTIRLYAQKRFQIPYEKSY